MPFSIRTPLAWVMHDAHARALTPVRHRSRDVVGVIGHRKHAVPALGLELQPVRLESSIVCVGDRRFSAEYRNLPVAGDILHKRLDIAVICDIASSLPVMRSLRPAADSAPAVSRAYRAPPPLPRTSCPRAAADDDKLRLCCFFIVFHNVLLREIYLSVKRGYFFAVKAAPFPSRKIAEIQSTLPSRTRRSFVT